MGKGNSWGVLIDFESRDLVERAYKGKHNRTPNVEHLREITSSFVQAREYHTSAINAGFTVRPLLLYYSVAALTKGLLLMTVRQLRETALKPSHGLEVNDWRRLLSNGIEKIGSLSVTVRSGTFTELLEKTENQSHFRVNTSKPNWWIKYPVPQVGATFSFTDIVSLIPDLSREYKSWSTLGSPLVKLNGLQVTESSIKINLYCPNSDFLPLVFPADRCKYTIIRQNGDEFDVELESSFWPLFVQSLSDPFSVGIGEVHIVPPISSGVYLNTLGTYFACSYFLGMLARYFPSTWISLGQMTKGDSVFPLIRSSLDLIQNNFPSVVLDHITKTMFESDQEGTHST